MTVQMIGSKRPMLSLPFGRTISSQQHLPQGSIHPSGALSTGELRRIVSEMLG